MKTVIADTCSSNGDCYSPKRKNGRLEQNKNMPANVRTNCITKYFSVSKLDDGFITRWYSPFRL